MAAHIKRVFDESPPGYGQLTKGNLATLNVFPRNWFKEQLALKSKWKLEAGTRWNLANAKCEAFETRGESGAPMD